MLLPLPRRLLKLDRVLLRIRELSQRQVEPTAVHPAPLRSPLGHALHGRLHTPPGDGSWPGVLLVPGGLDGADSLESPQCVLPAQRLARAGFATFVFTPSGREGSPGPADCNGPVHQAECAVALQALVDHPRVRPGPVAILSLSFGLVMALGALRDRSELAARVGVLIDWEGPGHRRWFEAAGIGSDPDDHTFWEAREGVRLIEGLTVPYRRFQSRWDHVHGPDTEIGWEMVQAAIRLGCPAVSLNDHPLPLPVLEQVRWGPGLRSRQGAILLQWLIHAVWDLTPPPPG